MDESQPLVNETSTDPFESAYQQHSRALERFLIGVLRDSDQVGDVMQSTFVVMMEKGQSVKDLGSVKSWLFRVAFNEAMLIKRRQTTSKRHSEKVAWRIELNNRQPKNQLATVLQLERAELVQDAISELSVDQQKIVKLRIYEGLKFREIAEQLDIPLGTVLARMHSSLKKLKPLFDNDDFHTE